MSYILVGGEAGGGQDARHTVRELENAWEAAQLRKNLRSSGVWSILWGAFAILGGLASLEQSSCNGVLVLIGLFLVGTGIASWRKPSPGALQADAAAMLLVGLWNIAITLMSGDSSQSFWAIAGVVQIVWAVQRFARHSKFTQVQHVPESLIAHVETLVKHIQRANVAATGDLIQFQAKGKRWKAHLTPDIITLVAGNAQEVRFVAREEFALTAQGEATPGKRAKASIKVRADTWTGRVPYESLQRYDDWQAGRLAPPEPAGWPAQSALGAATPAAPAAQRPLIAAMPLAPAFEYASFWRRAAAMLIDTLLFAVPYLLVMVGLGALVSLLGSGVDKEVLSNGVVAVNCVVQILGLTVFWLYYAVMESSSWQATLGKRALSIVVTDLDGNRISFGRATARYWAKFISGLIMGIGYLMALFTERRQTLHDTLSGCLVVGKEAAAGTHGPVREIPQQTVAPATAEPVWEMPLPATVVDQPVSEPHRTTGEGKLDKIGFFAG